MTFEETKEYLQNHTHVFNGMFPELRNPDKTLHTLIDTLDKVFSDQDMDASTLKPENDFLKELNLIVRKLNETIMINGMTSTEELVVMCFSDVLSNYRNLFNLSTDYDTAILFNLIKSKKTIDDSIKLLDFVFDKFKRFESCNLESKTSTLSRKYYDEIKAFMERKGDHDASYDTNKAIKN